MKMDTPLTWKLDMGTEPRLSPYLNIGAGLSFDFIFKTRFSLLAVTENHHLVDTARPHYGAEALFMTKGSSLRSYLSAKYLYSTSFGTQFSEYGMGVSLDVFQSELRVRS